MRDGSPRCAQGVGALLVLVVCVPSSVEASWFCSVQPDAPQPVQRLLSELEHNYVITGVPAHPSDSANQVKFQFSFKYDLVPNEGPCGLFFGYTHRSLWRAWDVPGNSPFEDSNYNPSLFLVYGIKDVAEMTGLPSSHPLNFLWARLGVEHESNGGGNTDSRGWDRIFASTRFGLWFQPHDVFYVTFEPKLWFPFFEGNPDLLGYVGYGQLATEGGWQSQLANGRWQDLNVRVLLRGGWVGAGAHGSIEVSVSYRPPWPVPNVSLYAQAFSGYNETLLHYNEASTSFRFGFAFDDRLLWGTSARGEVRWIPPPS